MYSSRPVQPEDLQRICAFPQTEEELYYMFPRAVYPLTPEQLAEAIRSRLEPTVILNGSSEAIAYFNFYDRDEEACWLGNVIVSPEYRGQGASGYLIETAQKTARETIGVRKLRLVCHNTNTRALLYYKKHGFRPFDVSARTKPSGESIAGILMEKEI